MNQLEAFIKNDLKPKLQKLGITNFYFLAKDPDFPGSQFLRSDQREWLYGELSKEIREIEHIWDIEISDYYNKLGGEE